MFYSIIGEIPIPIGKDENPKLEEFLCNENPKDEYYLTEKDIELRKKNINFGFKDKNPFKTINFFNSKRPNICFKKSMEHLLIMPQVFSESTILVFCKDKKKNQRAKNLFEIYKNKLYQKWNLMDSPKNKYFEKFDIGGKLLFNDKEVKNMSTPKFGIGSYLKKRERSDKNENFDDSNEK